MNNLQKKYLYSVGVVIIDSGISSRHDFGNSISGGISIVEGNGECVIEDGYEDEIGHGTAVADILLNTAPAVKIFCIKIFENEIVTSLNKLCFALEYIYENIDCKLILISGGLTVLKEHIRLNSIINYLYNKKTYLISAFDNDGAVSYPAALENVIGIDISPDCNKKEEFELVEGSIIDIRGAGTYFRVKWVEPKNIIIKGSSFTASYITGLILNNLVNSEYYESKTDIINSLRQFAKRIHKTTRYKKIFNAQEFVTKIEKAIIFPFNKEIHSIAAFSDTIDFEIIDYFDVKYSNNINKRVDKVVSYCNNNNKIIKSFQNIDWNSDFDTIICGHCDLLTKTIGYDILDYFITQCLKYNKRMYTFDNIYQYIKDIDGEKLKLFYFPFIDVTSIPQNRFGKLRYSSKPVVGVFGTSSNQGKYTLQLYLRKLFKERNFKVGQIGTEPSGFLFGFDNVYPMGYNSSVFVNTSAAVNVLNEMIWQSELNNPDVVIVGSQSGTIPYDFGNLSRYTFSQYDFLLGTLPDAFILCVNPNDEIEYIQRTVQYIECLIGAKNIGVVLYPIKTTAGKTGINMTKKIIDISEFDEIKKTLNDELSVSVYNLTSKDSINELVNGIIDFFRK